MTNVGSFVQVVRTKLCYSSVRLMTATAAIIRRVSIRMYRAGFLERYGFRKIYRMAALLNRFAVRLLRECRHRPV